MKKLFMVCNAHLDPVWLWNWQEGAAAAIAGALMAAAVDTDLLRRPFGIYLLLAAGITLRQLWRDRKG